MSGIFICPNCRGTSIDSASGGLYIDAKCFENGDGRFFGPRGTCRRRPGIHFATRDDFDNYVAAKASGGVAS